MMRLPKLPMRDDRPPVMTTLVACSVCGRLAIELPHAGPLPMCDVPYRNARPCSGVMTPVAQVSVAANYIEGFKR